jgi:hypothetical protein
MTMSVSDVAMRFESLGGGGLTANGWAFGCEFGYWQRSLRLEPLGLLRWASIRPENLKRGLEAGFLGVDDPKALELREHTAADWGAVQTTYGMHLDHTNMDRAEVTQKDAIERVTKGLGFLRHKLLSDLKEGEKLFVYRTFDHTLDDEMQMALANAVRSHGESTLLYVQIETEDHPAFTAVRKSSNLIVGYIDHFAPRNGRLDYNPEGWEAVCRAALDVWLNK